MLAAAWGVYAAFGLLVATTGALVPAIRTDLELSGTQMGLVLGAWQLVFIGSSIPAGRIIDRFGARRAVLAAVTVMLLSGIGRAAAGDMITLFLAAALFGVGAPIVSVAVPTVASNLFEDGERRRAVAIYSTAPGVGGALGLFLPGALVGPAVEVVVGEGPGTWRWVMVLLSAVAGLALVNWAVATRGLDGLISHGAGPGLSDYRYIAGTPIVRFMLVLAVLSFFFIHGIGQWIVAIFTDAGWTSGQAGALAALGTVGGLVAGYVLPRLATPVRRPILLAGALMIGAVSTSFLQSTGLLIAVVALLLVTVARTAVLPLLVMTMMDHPDVGPGRIAAATGLFFTTAQIGGVSGPAVTGALSDSFGGFRIPLIVHGMLMLAVAGAVVVGFRRTATVDPVSAPIGPTG